MGGRRCESGFRWALCEPRLTSGTMFSVLNICGQITQILFTRFFIQETHTIQCAFTQLLAVITGSLHTIIFQARFWDRSHVGTRNLTFAAAKVFFLFVEPAIICGGCSCCLRWALRFEPNLLALAFDFVCDCCSQITQPIIRFSKLDKRVMVHKASAIQSTVTQ